MAKKNKAGDFVSGWSKAISESWDKQREIDNRLSPSKSQLRYVVDWAREINKIATYIEYTSALAHEGLMDFEQAQTIIDHQKNQLSKAIDSIKPYLSEN